MTAARKISEAESIIAKMQAGSDEYQTLLDDFVGSVNEIFLHLLEEYNLKFGCKIDRISLEKFKIKAKRAGNIGAINFLIWYEKEYRKIRDSAVGDILEGRTDDVNCDNIVRSCSTLLDEVRTMTYYAYEHF